MRESMQGSRTETSFRNWTRLVAGRRKKQTAAAMVHSRSADRLGTRETQPPSSLPQQVGSASQQFAAYRLFLCIGPCCSSDRQAYQRPRGKLSFQYTDTSVNFVPQWECECPRQSETAVESPDQSPPGLFNHLETPLGSTRTVQSRLSIHRNFSFPTTNILLLEQAPYNARSTLIYPCKAALSPILAQYDVGSCLIAFRGCAQNR
jgi:hypothetical protein